MAKSAASANLFRTIGICNIFSVIPIPTNKSRKEDFHRAGKAPGQTKHTFVKKVKIV